MRFTFICEKDCYKIQHKEELNKIKNSAQPNAALLSAVSVSSMSVAASSTSTITRMTSRSISLLRSSAVGEDKHL